MRTKAAKKLLLAATFASATAVSGLNVLADNAFNIFTDPSGTLVTYDNASGNYPVITAILSQPGTVNGRTYTSWSFLAQDSTGSLDMFGALPSGSSYVPTVGDGISVSGTYSPFHQIPEVGTMTSISLISSGHAAPAVGVSTIPTLNQTTLPQGVAGRLWELDNVTISGAGAPGATFGTVNSPSGAMITDGSNNSMTFFYWPTSYSTANANMANVTIPSGPVNMVGFVSVFTSGGVSTTEFNPISIIGVPEPASLALFGISGSLILTLVLRQRSTPNR
jgi:hypothetical protein